MSEKPEFFWSPPDGAPIIGMTQYEGMIVVATASGVYVIKNANRTLEDYQVHKISHAPKEFWTRGLS